MLHKALHIAVLTGSQSSRIFIWLILACTTPPGTRGTLYLAHPGSFRTWQALYNDDGGIHKYYSVIYTHKSQKGKGIHETPPSKVGQS